MSEGTDTTTEPQPAGPAQVPVWDVLVRIGHWLLVTLFTVAYFTEDSLLTLHSWAGYGVGLYVIVRVIWGFSGPRHARFADFAYGPIAAARYLRDLIRFRAQRHIGHSPAGAEMVFVLLACLAATVVSGTALLAVRDNAGPLAPWLGPNAALEDAVAIVAPLVPSARASENDDVRRGDAPRPEQNARRPNRRGGTLREIHEFLSNLTATLVILHICGVILASIVHRENLVRAMITGRKRADPTA